jgi:hypothetical protein
MRRLSKATRFGNIRFECTLIMTAQKGGNLRANPRFILRTTLMDISSQNGYKICVKEFAKSYSPPETYDLDGDWVLKYTSCKRVLSLSNVI